MNRYYPEREADPASDRIASVIRPDGTTSTYQYESGNYEAEGGIPAQFEPVFGGPFLRVIELTVPTALPNGVAGRTLRTSAVFARNERQLLSETSILESVASESKPAVWAPLSWTTSSYDERNRLIETRDATGVTGEYRYNDCCDKLEWHRDASGDVTSYVYDALNRRIATIREYPGRPSIETHYRCDDLGREIGETIVAGDIEQTTTRTLDVFGRVVSESGADGLTTRHEYEEAARTRTAILPGGATRVEKNFLDGQRKEASGTAIVAT
ncbi:MAG: RHS repeat protein, partial [Verrucomicrobiales bacterium]|nr:RHS repeat protein [Verrucomicrobiales bacterium]